MAKPVYKRVLLKISGEALAGDKHTGLDFEMIGRVCDVIKECLDLGVQVGLVVGGGNFWRGAKNSGGAMERTRADHMGMLATVMNCLAVADVCEQKGIPVRVQTAVEMSSIAEPYIRSRAIRHMEKGRVVIFGAGTGCTVGKIRGAKFAMKGGIGCCAYRQGDLMVGAVVACNAMGDVWDHGQIIAGARNDENTGFANSEEWLIAHGERQLDVFSEKFVGQNTVIGCVVTNAALTKPQTAKLAAVAQNGIARAVRPANATFDGDSMFAMACGSVAADPDAVGILAARAVEEAICRGVRAAESLHGRPAIRDLPFGKDKNS